MSQVSEMENIRQKLQYLESNQVAIKQRSATFSSGKTIIQSNWR